MQFIRFFIIWLLITVLAWFKANGQVVINEYQCSNLSTVTDFYNQYEDWFELYNAGASSVDLTGYYLSDKAGNPTKWQIPSGSVAANGFIRVFCNGRNASVGGQLHPSFKLTQTKAEKIILADPSGIIIDSLTIRLHQPNHSWGRTQDGASTWGVYTAPTCGATNGTGASLTRYAAKPAFSLAGGFYSGPQTVTLSTTEPGATIYYTLDGSVPDATSTVYSGPLSITEITVVKAYVVAAASDVLPSWYEFNTYLLDVGHTMPVVSLSGNQIVNLLNGNSGLKPITAIEFYDTDQSFKFKTVGRSDKHGNDSWAYDQRGIDYTAWDQYGYNHSMDHKFFPRSDRDEFQRVIFKAGASDNYPFGGGSQQCHMRDAFVHDYAEKAGLHLEGRRVAHCVIYVNGEYWGLYETREKLDDADYMEYYHNQGEWDIDLLKYWGGLQVDYGSDTGWVALYNYVMNPANPMSDPVKYDYVNDRLSIQNFIDYCIYNTYLVNSDWINWNSAWFRGRNPNGDRKKWNHYMWDMDNVLGLGQNFSGWGTTGPTADPCDLANNSQFQNAGPNMGLMDILTSLLVSEDFHEQYILRYADLMNGKLSCDSIIEHLDYFESVLAPEMPGQTARWGGTVGEWTNNVQGLRDFLNSRCSFIAGSITGCYDVTGPYTLTVLVDPPGAGTVQVNSFTPPGYPYTGSYFGDITMRLQSFVNPDYVFGYWIPGVTPIAPGILSDTISMTMTSNDTIIAHFKYWPALGVENQNEMNIAVFPTVTNDQLIIDFRGLHEPIASCRMTNVTGQQVADLSQSVNGLVEGRKVMSLRELGLAPGMYFVDFKSGTHQHIAKVVYQVD